MTRAKAKEKCLEALKEAKEQHDDPEAAHSIADNALTQLLRDIGWGDVADEFDEIEKWYA